MRFEITAIGTGLALQDGGRVGWRRFGVPPGGALDRHAMGAANRLVGNPPDAPVLEVFRQGACLRALESGWVGLAGAASCPNLAAWTARPVAAGERLEFSEKVVGVFSYLAVPGGFRAEHWFGSVSADPRNGLGRALAKGDLLEARGAPFRPFAERVAARQINPEQRRAEVASPEFLLLPGPQFEAFSAEAHGALVRGPWTVSPRSDRTGYRLEGPALQVPESIASEPVIPGSFQVPGNGQPIITMADGPTVGGYPKIAVLRDADVDRLAQCAPGAQIKLRWASH
ncbi:MAG: biotin-dependent carboxyltransferase family protein [Opitutales bacterium]